MRAAYAVGTTVVVGNAYYLETDTTEANESVENSVFDYFNLTAGTTYNFGVNFTAAPATGTDTDWCSEVVQILSR